jgi:hypothetical protein
MGEPKGERDLTAGSSCGAGVPESAGHRQHAAKELLAPERPQLRSS